MSEERILLAHGGGGRLTHRLVETVFRKRLANPALDPLDDSAELSLDGERWAFTTDAYTVKPIFFTGGDIGKLAICGTINDLAMKGARPLYLSAAFVIEEGLLLSELERIADSMAEVVSQTNVWLACGDTKVVARGEADQVFITTSGVGKIPPNVEVSGSRAKPGCDVLLSGTLADHEIAVLASREGFRFTAPIQSDCAPLAGLVSSMLEVTREIACLRDPTRGGLATALNEIALQSGVGIIIEQDQIPIAPAVQSACEMLGYDPLYAANEGKLICIAPPVYTEGLLAAMRRDPFGANGQRIGCVVDDPLGVWVRTPIGSLRPLPMLEGEQLPRIC